MTLMQLQKKLLKAWKTVINTLSSLNKSCPGCSSDGHEEATKQLYKHMFDGLKASDKIQTGNISEAQSILENSHKEFEKKVAPIVYGQESFPSQGNHDPFKLLTDYLNTQILIDSGRENEAVKLIDRVLSSTNIDAKDRIAADFKVLRLEAAGQHIQAIQELKNLIALNVTHKSSTSQYDVTDFPRASNYLERLANLYIKVAAYSKAKENLNNRLVIAEKYSGSNSIGVITSRIQIAWINAIEGKIEQSTLSLKDLIIQLESKVGKLHPKYMDAKLKYITLLF